jgi:hypothetical protein
MPVTAGTMAAPAIAVAICEPATTQNSYESKISAEAATTQIPGTMTHARLKFVVSINPPIGIVMSIPATLPNVIAVPIRPLSHPRPSKNTPRNGPIPDCISAMKKFSASSGQSRSEEDGCDRWWDVANCFLIELTKTGMPNPLALLNKAFVLDFNLRGIRQLMDSMISNQSGIDTSEK